MDSKYRTLQQREREDFGVVNYGSEAITRDV